MSQQTVIDCQKFVLERKPLEGTLAVSTLKRLHDQLSKIDGDIHFELSGWRGDKGQICLSLQVKGVLHLVCQRCLEGFPFELDIDSQLEMLPEGEDLTQDELENDSKDYLPLEKTLGVSDLVEDEVILALPVAARHTQCELLGRAEAGGPVSPFAALVSIKTGLN
ncbi:MAG: hypothetical protein RIR18_1508 [Pseudomonadota bacterium]|jgi:uncharacterized protein